MPSLSQDLNLMLLYAHNDSDLDCPYMYQGKRNNLNKRDRESVSERDREIKMPYQQIKVS